MFGFLLGIVSAAVSVISSIAATVGPAIATVAKTIVSLAPTLQKVIIFGNVVSDIAKILGVLGPEENAEDIGAKAMQEGTRPREINESAQDYLDYLRNEVELDREKQAKMDEKDRMACIAAGSALVLATTAEKNDVELTPTYIANASKSRLMSADNILKMAYKFKDNNIEINKFNEYFDNNLSGNELLKTHETIKTVVKEINPDMSEKEIRNEITNMESEIKTVSDD